MSEASELENKEKKQVPRNDQIILTLYWKKKVFQTHLRVRTPTTGPVEKW